jgi:hypothetical protein
VSFRKLRLLELNPSRCRSLAASVPAKPQHLNLARIRRSQALANLDGGRLARAIGTQETEAFARAHLQIDVVDGNHILMFCEDC